MGNRKFEAAYGRESSNTPSLFTHALRVALDESRRYPGFCMPSFELPLPLLVQTYGTCDEIKPAKGLPPCVVPSSLEG